MSRILIACGGTGGHLAPGIAIAEVLQSRGHDCILLISQKQVDSALIEKYAHLNFHKTPGQAFSGGLKKSITSCWSLLSGCLFSYKLVRKENPDLVLLFGGFLSVGLGLAARLAGVSVAEALLSLRKPPIEIMKVRPLVPAIKRRRLRVG